MVLFFYLSRLLQAEGLGIYSTVLAIFQTASLGCGIGFNSYLPRELPRDLSKTNRYFIHASVVSVAVAVVIAALLTAVVPFLGYLPLTKTGIYIISTALIAESLLVVLNATFIAHQKAEFITATGLVNIIGRIIVSLIVLRLGFGVIGLIVVYTVFDYLSLLVNLFFLNRFIVKPKWEFDWRFLWQMLQELKVFAGLALLNALCSQSEVVILSITRGETQVGYYSAALKLVTIWSMIPSSYMTAMFPVLSATFEKSKQKAIELQNKSLKYLLAAAFPLTVGMAITAGQIIPLIYGNKFQESVDVLRILSWYLPLIFFNNLLWRVLFVRGEQRVVFRWQLLTEILQAFLALWLTPIYGSIGAAWAVLGGNLAYAVYFVYFLQRAQLPLPLVQVGWRFLLASAVMGLVAWVGSFNISIFIVIPVAAVIYIGVVWLLNAFSAEDKAIFMEILRFKKDSPSLKREAVSIELEK